MPPADVRRPRDRRGDVHGPSGQTAAVGPVGPGGRAAHHTTTPFRRNAERRGQTPGGRDATAGAAGRPPSAATASRTARSVTAS